MHTPVQEKLIAGAASAIIVALMGYLLLLGLSVDIRAVVSRPMALLDLRPPPPEKPHPKPPRPKAKAAAHPPSPRNLKNTATPVVAPPPLVTLPPPPPPIVAATKPALGMAASTGASDRAGPGQGAGGEGNGNGGGGDGDDDGDTPPRLLKGRLSFSDLPADLRAAGIGGTVAVRYHVGTDGRVGDCTATASSGGAELGTVTCRLIQQRFRFDPSRDPDGRPVRSIIVESHSWIIDRSEETPDRP